MNDAPERDGDLRTASCSCGALQVRTRGAPVRVSVCHCLSCQRRSGSVFAIQARFPVDCVEVIGESTSWQRRGESGATICSRFCPRCGSTVYYTIDDDPGRIAVAVGAFADPQFPPPWVSVYEEFRHPWTGLPDQIEHHD